VEKKKELMDGDTGARNPNPNTVFDNRLIVHSKYMSTCIDTDPTEEA